MAHFFGGFFKHIEKPQDTHPPSVPQTFSQYDNEYITYCIEQEQTISNLEAQLTHKGLSLDMYCSFMNTTREALRKDFQADAEAELRKDAAVRQIVKLEQLEVSKEELGEAVAQICRQNGITVEQLKPHYDEAFEQAVIKSVLTGKAMRLIRDAAVITVV